MSFTMRFLAALQKAGRLEQCLSLLCYLRSPLALPFHNQSELDLLDQEIDLTEKIEAENINLEVEKRRYRLGADPYAILRNKVTAEVYAKSNLEQLMMDRLGIEPNESLADRLLDRIRRKMSVTEENSKSKCELLRILLRVAREYQDSSVIAKDLILDLTDWDDIFELVNNTDPPSDENTEPITLYKALQKLVCYWKAHNLHMSEKSLILCKRLIFDQKKIFGIELPKITRQLERLWGLFCATQGRYLDAISIFEKIDSIEQDEEASPFLLHCYRQTENYTRAIELAEKILVANVHSSNNWSLLSDLGWDYHMIGDEKKALEILQKSEALNSYDSLLLSRLGIVMWNDDLLDDKAICYDYFLAACRADQNNAHAFLYLGKYYCSHKIDKVRAEKCFLKTLTLNPTCLEAAMELSDIWLTQCKEVFSTKLLQSVVKVLESFSLDHPLNSRLWTFLAVAFAGLKKYPQSVHAYHNALKGDGPNELQCLLGIAQGYHQQDKHTASAKAFKRILELYPDCITAKVGLGLVLSAADDFVGAITQLESITEKTENPTLAEFVELEILRNKYLYCHRLATIGCVNMAVETIIKLMEDLLKSSLNDQRLEILSDLCRLSMTLNKTSAAKHLITPTQQFLTTSLATDSNELSEQIFAALPNDVDILMLTIAKVSAYCNLRLILDCEDSSTVQRAWCSLAQTLAQIIVTPSTCGVLFNIIIDCANQATSSPHLANAWLVKGVAHSHLSQYGMSQHCFIKAINRGSIYGWLNLAYLYYRVGEIDLARHSLQRIQIDYPEDSALAWLYTALLDRAEDKERIEYMGKIGLATDLIRGNLDVIDALNTVRLISNGADDCFIIDSAKKRFVFNCSDQMSYGILHHRPKTIPRPIELVELGKTILSHQLSDRETLLAAHMQLKEYLEGPYRADAQWLRSLALFLLEKHELALQESLDILDIQGEHNPRAWCHLLFWYERLVANEERKESASRITCDYFRIRMTVDYASRVVDAQIAEIILKLWSDKTSDEISKILHDKILFYNSFDLNLTI